MNGAPIRFLVDTGATDIVLSREDARRVGIELEELAFLGRANTANGPVKTAQVRLESIEIGQFRDEALRASVNGGELGVSLLGQRYLNRFERIEITARQMRLSR